jgi:hypothetical protein
LGLAVSDFNGDGKPDIAVSELSTQLWIFLGNGDGTFAAPLMTTTQNLYGVPVAGDFNGDGKADLIFNTGNVFLGNGDGTFRQGTSFSAALPSPGDLNGDGITDLVIPNITDNTVTVLLGNADGTFRQLAKYPAGFGVNLQNNLSSVLIADLNGDGNADVVFSDPADNVFGIFYGYGDGTLRPPVFVGVSGPGIPVVADFNADGRPDLAFTNSAGSMIVLGGLASTVSTTTLTSSLNPSVVGQNVTYTATVAPSSATGTVLFFDEASFLGMRTLVNGQAMLSSSLLGIGARLITANYLGDANNPASFSLYLVQAVVAPGHSSTTTFGSSTNPAVLGQSVTLVANVAPASATGTVTFYDGSLVLGSAAVNAGRAALTTSLLASGIRKLMASYLGDANYAGSSSPKFTQTVSAAPSAGLQPSLNTAGVGSVEGIASGDFNNDGLLDFVVAAGNTISIYLGNGDGTFRKPMNAVVNQSISSIVAADFNLDGKTDVAVSSSSGFFSVLLGNGDGTLQAASIYAGGGQNISVADFNGDGKPDLLTGSGVFLGNGDGTFGPQLIVGSSNPKSVTAVGDFNGDGKPDFAAINANSNAVRIFLGNGDGTFQPPADYNTDIRLTSLVTADFNGDGKIDIAGAGGSDSAVMVLSGAGDGTFLVNTYRNVLTGANLVVGDFNGDGKPDLAGLSVAYGYFGILYGKGDGTFTDGAFVFAPAFSSWGVVGDFNRDGRTDLIVTNFESSSSQSYSVAVLLGGSSSTVGLTSSVNPSIYGQSVTLQAAVTSNGGTPTGVVTFYDGTSVLGVRKLVNGVASLTLSLPSSGKRALTAYYGGGGGFLTSTSAALRQTVNPVASTGFLPPAAYWLSQIPNSLAVGDFNGDGKPDLAAATGNFVSVWINNGNGVFQAPVMYGSEFAGGLGPNKVATGDFNGDGFTDIASVTIRGNLAILLGNGDGTFRAGGTFNATNTFSGHNLGEMAVGDFNGDGKLDVVTCDLNGTVNVVLGYGDGTFRTPMSYYGNPLTSTGSPLAVTVGDFNGDGRADVAFTNYAYDNIGVLLGFDDSMLQRLDTFTVPGKPVAIASGDINGDGKSDVVVANTAGSVSVLLGNGDGRFMPAVSYPMPGQPNGLVLADINGDGKLDLAVTNSQGGTSILLGNGDGTFGSPVTYDTGIGWGPIAAADFNGDGRVDLAIAGEGVYVLLGKAGVSSSVGVFRNGASFLEDSNGNGVYDPGVDRFIASFTGPGGFVSGDVPVAGDWNGDGHAKVGIYRGSTGQWFLDANNNGALDAGDLTYSFGGVNGDVPVVGDWAGLGKSCVGVFRSGFLWVLDLNCNGKFDDTPADAVFPFGGVGGDVPVVGAWTGTTTRVGVVRKYAPAGVPIGNPFYWVLDGAAANAGTAPASHQPGFTFAFGGLAGDVFVTGDWYNTGTSVAGVFRTGLWVLDAALPSAPQAAHTTGITFGYGGVLGDVPVLGKW